MRGVAHLVQERELLMRMRERGKSLAAISRDTGIARRALRGLGHGYREQGRAGPQPRSRRPERSPNRLAVAIEQEILQLRGRGWGPARIAAVMHNGHSSVHRVLAIRGRNRLRRP